MDVEVITIHSSKKNEAESNYVLDCAFSSASIHSPHLGVLYSDSSVTLLDSTTFKSVYSKQIPFSAAAFAVQNNFIWVTGEDGQLCGYDVRSMSKNSAATLDLSRPGIPFNSVALSDDSELLTVGTQLHFTENSQGDDSDDNEEKTSKEPDTAAIYFFDLRSDAKCLGSYDQCHSDTVTCLRFEHNSHDQLASGSADSLINIFDLRQSTEDDALQQTLNLDSPVNRICWAQLGNEKFICATSDDNKFGIWDENFDAVLSHSFKDVFLVDCVAAGDSILPVSCDAEGNVRVGRWSKQKQLNEVMATFSSHSDIVRCLAWHANSQILVTGGDDGNVVATRIRFSDSAPQKANRKRKTRFTKKKPY